MPQMSNGQRVGIAAICAVLAVILLAGRNGLRQYQQSRNSSNTDREQIVQQVDAVKLDIDTLKRTLSNSGKEIGVLADKKDQYIAVLGTLTQNNNLSVSKMTVSPIQPATDIASNLSVLPVEMDVQGTLPQIRAFIAAIGQADYLCRVVDVSCRTQDAYAWLWRQIDDDTYVPWWTPPGEELDQSTSTDDAAVDADAPRPEAIEVKDLMSPNQMRCFIKIEYLGWDGESG